jgi:hypothetical protein
MSTSFHVSNFGSFGRSLPCDLDGYCHLTAEEWHSAPMDATVDQEEGWAESMAQEARDAVADAESAMAEWREKN